jgi:hypothetical protein
VQLASGGVDEKIQRYEALEAVAVVEHEEEDYQRC